MGFLCCVAKSYFKSLECNDCRQHVGCVLPFRSWSLIGLSSSLLLVFGLYVIYILRCISYTYKSLLILFLVMILLYFFIAKAFLIGSVVFKSYSYLSNFEKKTERGSQSKNVAQWVRPAIEHAQDVLSGGLGQERSINSSSLFWRFLFVFNLSCLLYYGFFLVYLGCVLFFKIQIVCFGFLFRFFLCFVLL